MTIPFVIDNHELAWGMRLAGGSRGGAEEFARPNGQGDSEKALQLSEQFLVLITCR